MFGWNFFKRKDEGQSPEPGKDAREGDQQPRPHYVDETKGQRGPLVDRVLDQLERARNKFIRFDPSTAGPNSLISTVMPGDVIVAGDVNRLVLSIDGDRLRCLTDQRGYPLKEELVKAKRIPVSEISEVITSRGSGMNIAQNLTPEALSIARIMLGEGHLGSEFRQIVVKGEPLVVARVSPDDGRILGVFREGGELSEDHWHVVLAMSSLFDSNRDFIENIVPLDEIDAISEQAIRNLVTGKLIANSFENVVKLKLMEGISGF